MRVANTKPLIFLDTPSIDELSVEFRRIHSMLQDAMKIAHTDFTELQQLINKDSTITYGIVKAGEFDPEGVKIVKVENMRGDRSIDTSDLYRVSTSVSQQYSRTILEERDILVSIKGTIGRVAEVPEDLIGGNITRDSALIRLADKDIVEFIMLYLESELAQLQMTLHSRGAAVKGINLSDLREVKIPIVDKHNQDLIVKRYNEIVNVSRSKINHLILIEHKKIWDRINKAFASELNIEDFPEIKREIVFIKDTKNSERLDIQANHPDYINLVSQIRKSPTSGSLSDLIEVSENRFNPDEHQGEQVNYLAIGDIDGLSGKIIDPQIMISDELPSRARRLVYEGDILVGIAGASTGTENMVVFPVTSEQNGWVATTGFMVVHPKKDVNVNYLCSLLKSPFVLRQIRALLISPAMPTISESDFLAIMVPVTNFETRKKTLLEIENILIEGRQLTWQLEDIGNQIEELIAKAKSNIHDLLDDAKYSAMSSRVNEIQAVMTQVEEVLQ